MRSCSHNPIWRVPRRNATSCSRARERDSNHHVHAPRDWDTDAIFADAYKNGGGSLRCVRALTIPCSECHVEMQPLALARERATTMCTHRVTGTQMLYLLTHTRMGVGLFGVFVLSQSHMASATWKCNLSLSRERQQPPCARTA